MDVHVKWSEVKNYIDTNGDDGSLSYLDIADQYIINMPVHKFNLICKIDKEDTPTADQAEFEAGYKANANKKLHENGVPKTAAIQLKSDNPSFPKSTHDFCNKQTWWTNSVRVVDEVLTTSDNLTYSAVNTFFIDTINGITSRQDLLVATHGMIIKVDDVAVTTGFTIDHRAGTVTFDSSQSGSNIKLTYSYATNSQWEISADQGKVLNINKSEIQFSMDTQINTPLRFQVWIDNPYFAVPGHPYEGIPRIPAKTVQYNSMRDFVNEANLGQGSIPQVGDLPTDIVVFPFNYISNQPIQSSYNATLVIDSVGDIELTGSYGTATFYLMSKDEIV